MNSPVQLPSYDQALRMILADAPSPGPAVIERPLDLALGDTLAGPVRADRDLPPFNRAAMDGYAVRAADLASGGPTTLRLVGNIAAGEPADLRIEAGTCAAIATGAPVPEGADTVVPHEKTDRGDPQVTVREAVEAGFAIHPRAADAAAGDELLPAGITLGPHHLAIAATVGAVSLPVSLRAPSVTIISSGDEIRPPETTSAELLPHQIRESNVTYLRHAIPAFGGRVLDHLHARDEAKPTREAVAHAIATSDIVVTIGGISAGRRDRFPDAFEDAGVVTHLRGAAIQPGKPIFVGSVLVDDERPCLIVGLPGNPVSVLATSHLFLWPLVRRFRGLSPRLPWMVRPSARAVMPNPSREVFRPCHIEDRGVVIPEWHGSGDLAHVAPTTGLARLPVEDDVVEAGNPISCLPYAWNMQSPRPGVVG
ncbi:MAG: molybdopterin molybdotransferase MoeA [Phycisphaerales bacterium]|nr:molybdopterin molybdotransferase MoeA [Phycisphaerales bacterium]